MDMENGRTSIERIKKDDDPDRCQGINALGQCRFKVIPTTQYCPLHGHARVRSLERARVFKYQLERADFQNRLDGFANSETIKSLDEELAILRLLVQNFLKAHDIESVSTSIVDLIRSINNLSLICAKANVRLSTILEAESAVAMARRVLNTLKALVPDDVYAAVEEDVTELVERLHASAKVDVHLAPNYKHLALGSRLQEFMSSDKITSLRNEISVLRHIITEVLNSCPSEADLLCKANRINSLILQVASLVQSTSKIEDSLGLLLDKEAAVAFNSELLTIVGKHVAPDALQRLGNALTATNTQPPAETSDDGATHRSIMLLDELTKEDDPEEPD
jgi:hypothetical protein